MAGLVESVRAKVNASCLATRCSAEGCVVSMNGVRGEHVLINMDCRSLGIGRQDSRCDFIFVSDDGDWVVALELKRGSLDASYVVEQLRAGARFVERIIPRDVEVNFVPLAVYGGKFHRKEREELLKRANWISFRGERLRVDSLRCGRSIVEKLK